MSGAAEYEVTITTGTSNPPPLPDSLPDLQVTEDTLGYVWVFSPEDWDGCHVWVGQCTDKLSRPGGFFLLGMEQPLCDPFEHDLYADTIHGTISGILTCSNCGGTSFDPWQPHRFQEAQRRLRRMTERKQEKEHERLRRRRAYLEREFPRVDGGEEAAGQETET